MLRHLYAGAVAVVLPSLEEGFGLPAIEGAACGTPCIATRQSPLPDLLCGGGLFVDPTDVAALSEALRLLGGSSELRRSLGRAALERAGRLSWRSTAEATCAALAATARH
jgi:glycosyltransferase involved in cell wall biosynthesis